MKPLINLIHEPSGQRISLSRVCGLIAATFLMVFVPIGFYIHYAKIRHEQAIEENSKLLTGGEVPAEKMIKAMAQSLKQKSDLAVDNLGNNTSQPLVLPHSNSLAKKEIPAISESTLALSELIPPLTSKRKPQTAADLWAAEVAANKPANVKMRYQGQYAPISLSISNNSNGQNAASLGSLAQNLSPSSGIAKAAGAASSGVPEISGLHNEHLNGQLLPVKQVESKTMISSEQVKPHPSPYALMAGDFIPAVMISGLNSDVPGQVIAQVKENMLDTVHGNYLVMPKASRLIGSYDNQVAYLQKRLVVAWQRVIFPDGKSYTLQGLPGTDLAGYAGFYNPEGIDNHYWQIYGSSFVIGVITGAMQLSQANNSQQQLAPNGQLLNNGPTVGQTMTNALGQQMSQTSLNIANKAINVQPTLTMPPGYEFNIMLTADLVLVPYAAAYK